MLMRDGRITAFNPAAERTFGFPEAEVTAEGFGLSRLFGARVQDLLTMVDTCSGGLLDCRNETDLILDVSVHLMEQSEHPGQRLVVLRDVTSEQRYLSSLIRLNDIADRKSVV